MEKLKRKLRKLFGIQSPSEGLLKDFPPIEFIPLSEEEAAALERKRLIWERANLPYGR